MSCALLLMDVYMMVFSCATFSSIHMSGKCVHDTRLSQLLRCLFPPPHCSFAALLALSFLYSLSMLFFFPLLLSENFFLFSLPFQKSALSSEMSSSRWLSICSGNFLCLVTFASLSSFSNVASRPRYHNNLCLPAHPCA